MNPINPKILGALVKDRAVRRRVTREAHLMFFLVYLPHYIQYHLADFHHKIFSITQDLSNQLACIVAFRGSGKSTLVTMSYAIWSILGVHQKKFVLIVCQTKHQAKQHMMNLRHELENNKLLQSDLGPFQDETDSEWASSSLVFTAIGARITIASLEQSIRGIRHRQHRPDLIILDDIEDVASVKTMESRNKTFDWFAREIIPLGDLNTRIIVVGNFLHEDSLVARLKLKILNDDIKGTYCEFPLVDDEGICLWPGKFPTEQSLFEFKRTVINDISWQREYLLKVVDDEYQIIQREWIQYYDKLPDCEPLSVIVGIDPAISESQQADYTAMVCGALYEIKDILYLYILPEVINKRMRFPETILTIKALRNSLMRYTDNIDLVIESVSYQKALIQVLEDEGIPCEEYKVISDKQTRLTTISHKVKDGHILFSKTGTEKLIAQIIGFGSESHDDLVDAFTICAHKSQEVRPFFRILWN